MPVLKIVWVISVTWTKYAKWSHIHTVVEYSTPEEYEALSFRV